MKRGHGISGSLPVLTAAQREDIGRQLRRRWRLKRLIKRLQVALDEIPTNAEFVAKYGVSVQTLHSAARKTYAHEHPLDRAVPRETTPNNSEIRS